MLAAAISAIYIALHDIKGKALGVPVYQLLGGKQREYVPLFAHTQAPMGPQLLADARLLIEQGRNVIRTWRDEPDAVTQRRYEPRESIAATATWLARTPFCCSSRSPCAIVDALRCRWIGEGDNRSCPR